ncbi:MAG: DUF1585 domain-containing protein, partial [Bdellovibrionales bacterium]|nr:DUF1585 domain-containing protein [Bdellovibrionales bacterium]
VRGPGDALVDHPDPAGVITSRAFMEAHASAGTNRRLVEFTMRQFTCNPIENWADSTSPDSRVGRDIDRYPGGDGSKFQTTCKSCHGNMDGFRGAFAKFDFSDNFTKYANLYPNSGGRDRMRQMPDGIARKLNHNQDTFIQGHETLDDSWVNYARSPQNQELLGWRGSVAGGNGVNALAEAVANSRAFSQCMVKKVYYEVCRRDVATFEIPMVDRIADEFESEGYNLKALFEKIAISKECIGR